LFVAVPVAEIRGRLTSPSPAEEEREADGSISQEPNSMILAGSGKADIMRVPRQMLWRAGECSVFISFPEAVS